MLFVYLSNYIIVSLCYLFTSQIIYSFHYVICLPLKSYTRIIYVICLPLKSYTRIIYVICLPLKSYSRTIMLFVYLSNHILVSFMLFVYISNYILVSFMLFVYLSNHILVSFCYHCHKQMLWELFSTKQVKHMFLKLLINSISNYLINLIFISLL